MRFFARWALVATLATAALQLPVVPVARAQDESTDEQARRHFRLGQAHYENGSFLEAAHEFEQAYQLSQRPQLLYNVYVAYRDAGDLARSRDALREYLARVPEAENASMLRARLESLDRMLEQSPPTGQPETGATGDTTEPGASQSEPEGTADTTPEADPPQAEGPAETETGATASSGGGGLSPLPFAVAGVGAAMMIGGAITGALAMSSQDTLESTCPSRACPPGYDFEAEASNGRTLAITTDVLLFGGGAVLLGGVVWLVVDAATQGAGSSSETEQPPVTAACGATGCEIAAHFAF